MRAVVITEPGPPEVLRIQEVADPEAGPGEVRIRVQAAGVNRADILQRRGAYPAPEGWPPEVPGLEFAGVVDRVGPGVGTSSPGARVMGLVGGGGYAEYVVLPVDQLVPIPERLDMPHAAAVPEVFITAHDALATRLGVVAGETLLIHAIGSGVGTAALQIALARGVRVLGTTRTPWKLERARSLGLEVAIDASAAGFDEAVLTATDGRGVDAILDLVGAAYLEGNLRSLAELGRMVVVGLPSGRVAEIDLGVVLRNRLTIVGTALRPRSAAEKVAAIRRFGAEVLPMLEVGRIEPIVDRVLPMTEAPAAHALLESNETYGKVVLTW